MCKKASCDCQSTSAGENHQVPIEDNETSEDENEAMDSDDSYSSGASSDEEAVESDADSTSANRVTTDMVVWLLLKEQGLISEEMYAEKAVECEDDLRSLVRKLPKPNLKTPESSDNEDNEETENDGGLFYDDLFDVVLKEDTVISNGKGKNEAENKETSDTKKNYMGDLEENKISRDHRTKEKSNDEMTSTNEQVMTEGDIKIEETATATKQEPHELNGNDTKLKKELNEEAIVDVAQCNLCNTKQDAASSKTKESINEPNNTNKETRSFKDILQHIVKEKRISDDYEYVDVLESYVKDLDKHYKNNRAVDLFDKPTNDLKEFALFLNFYSPSSYKYIVATFNTPLPEHKELCSWYMKDSDSQPGLTERAFEIVKKKASGKRLTCSLMWRDIFMRNQGFNYNQVDYGGGCNFEYTDKATFTFVFVLVSLDEGWKIPIGYIFTKRIEAETQAELIRVCLTQCHEAGADVVAVTLESPTPAEFLGCSFQDPKNLKTVFKHPVCERDVAVWIDPCLALRSVRHTLKVKGTLLDDQGNKVRWNPIRKLRNLYSDDALEFQDPEFLKLRNHIAKVGLTTQIFSQSLAPALELCEKLLPESFKDTTATRRYIEIVNGLYDLLHSEITNDLGDVEQRLNTAKDYMIALFCNRENALSPFDKENLAPDKRLNFRSFLEGKPACGFIAFLICIESFKHLLATLVERERRIDHFNPHRLCKDHAEDFVINLRAFDGKKSEDFDGWSFQYFYGCLFDLLERNPKFSDKNIKMEHWSMYHKYTPVDSIKLTSGKRAYDEVYSFQCGPKKLQKTSHHDRATKLVRDYSKALDTEMDLSARSNMVGYIAGWIATKFARTLKCEECIDSVCGDRKLWFHKFITLKDVQGVCMPSEELFRICWECERALRSNTPPATLRTAVLRRLAPHIPWGPHRHRMLLVHAVISRYVPLRTVVPFTSKDKRKISNMFRLFSCMRRSGFFGALLEARNGDDD